MATPQPQSGGKPAAFTLSSRLKAARLKEYSLQGVFKYGYRNKEDISNLPAETLVIGSQNVLTNAAEQVTIRNGYSLDGAAGNQNTYGIDSAYDFNTQSSAGIQNLRKWGTNLELRYQNPVTSVVSWINIMSTLIATTVVNFTDFWDTITNAPSNTSTVTFASQVMLFVNGTNSIFRWSGAVGSYASSTSSTITLSGTNSLQDLNFDPTGNLLIDGVEYNYTGAGYTPNTVYSQTPTNAKVNVNLVDWISQIFTTGASASSIIAATVKVNFSAAYAAPVTFTGSIYTDNAGVPGTLISSANASFATVGGSGDDTINFAFNAVGVTPNTNYHLVISFNVSGLATVYIGASSGVGTHTSTNAGSTWSASNGFMNATVVENDSNTTTFTGVTPSPSGITVGDAVIQVPSAGVALQVGVSLPFNVNLIGTINGRNQIIYGSFSNNTVYVSKENNYADCTFSTPRLVGEGGYKALSAVPTAFIPQSDGMYISAGKSFWYRTNFVTSADLTNELFNIDQLKTASNQGAISQAYTTSFKNAITYVSHEPIFNSFGPVKNILDAPQVINMSDPIKYDMDAYNFTGGSSYYFNYFIYFSVPQMGIIRLFNVNKKYWEAPQTIPVGFFYQVNGALYGHSGTTNESYALFVAQQYNDNGNPINAIAAFPYTSQEGGSAPEKKNFNKHYTEGYIAGNTSLTLEINYEFGGYAGTYSVNILGSNKKIIFNKVTDGSLGRNPLGSQPIGSILNLPNQPAIPKFRVINTMPRINCFENQVVYSSNDVDQNWALLRFGPAIAAATDIGTEITL